MKNEESVELIQWGYELIKNAYLNRPEKPEELDSLYLQYLSPFSKEVYSLINSMLIFGGHDFKDLSKKPCLTVRDGLIPLSIFFMEMSPAEIKSDLYIHKDFWFLVPNEWREKIKFYDVQSSIAFSKKNLPKKIFVTGLLNSTLAEPEEFDASLKFLSDSLGHENIKNIEVVAYFPDKRNDLWGSWEEENVLRYSASIFTHLKLDIKTPLWDTLKTETNFKDCMYYEVNSGLFIKDTYVNHFVFSRGGGCLESKEVIDDGFKKISEVKASLYHQYNLYEFDYSKSSEFVNPMHNPAVHYLKRMLEFQNKDIRVNYKWEEWYATYIKRYYKNKGSLKKSIFKL